jgi:hypothetical protein
MTGGAYAVTGGGSNGGAHATAQVAKKKKGKSKGSKGQRGPAGPRGPEGKQGPAGPAGPAGAKGENGAAGAAGEKGAAGSPGSPGASGKSVVLGSAAKCASGGVSVEVEGSKSPQEVCNGATGYVDALPKGKTLTGSYAASSYAPGAGQGTARTAVNFLFRVENEAGQGPTIHYVPKGASAPPGCASGSAQAPEAEEGNLCIYGEQEENLYSGINSGHPVVCDFTQTLEECPVIKPFARSNPAGFGMEGLAGAAGSVAVFGTWAVTAE